MAQLDSEHVADLRATIEIVGQIRAVVRCKQHPEIVLAGKHLSAAGASSNNEFLLDVDERAQQIGKSHRETEWLIGFFSNIQRRVGEDERREELLLLANLLMEEKKIPRDGISSEISRILGSRFSARYVESLLPDEFKKPMKAEAGRTGGQKSAELSSARNGDDKMEPSKNSMQDEDPAAAMSNISDTEGVSPSLSQKSSIPAVSKIEPGSHIWDTHMPAVPVAEALLSQVGWQQAVYNQLGQAAFIKISQASGLLPDNVDMINLLPSANATPGEIAEHLRKYVAVYTKGLDDLLKMKSEAGAFGRMEDKLAEAALEVQLFKDRAQAMATRAAKTEIALDMATNCICAGDLKEFTKRWLSAGLNLRTMQQAGPAAVPES